MQTTDTTDWPAPAWPAWRLQESQQTAAVEPQDSFHGALAWLRILAATGDLEGARQKLATFRASLNGRILGSGELRQIIPIALLLHDQSSALHFLTAIFPTTIHIGFAVTASSDHSVVLMRVERLSITFIFSASLFSNDYGEILLQILVDVYHILYYYLESSLCSDGTVAINLADAGHAPGARILRQQARLLSDTGFDLHG